VVGHDWVEFDSGHAYYGLAVQMNASGHLDRQFDHDGVRSRRDVILAGAGADKVEGGGGNDVICGGSGRDTMLSGAGRDVLFGWTRSGLAVGGIGRDTLRGGPGVDESRQ
jgi:Ca2+-binding RTX toxin-like protein